MFQLNTDHFWQKLHTHTNTHFGFTHTRRNELERKDMNRRNGCGKKTQPHTKKCCRCSKLKTMPSCINIWKTLFSRLCIFIPIQRKINYKNRFYVAICKEKHKSNENS